MFIYPCFFIAGFVIVSGEGLQERIRQMRCLSLALGVALSAAYLCLAFSHGLPKVYLFGGSLKDLFLVLSSWSWLLAVLGFGTKHLMPMRRSCATPTKRLYPSTSCIRP